MKKENKIGVGVHLVCLLIIIGMVMNYDYKKESKTIDTSQTEITETIKNPDGQIITRKTVINRQVKTHTKESKKRVKENWIVGVSYSLFKPRPVYTVSIDRLIIWDMYLGVYGRTDKEVGVSLKIKF